MEIREEVLNFIKNLGVRFRHPQSDFYKAGNDHLRTLKPYGICDYDNEDFYHKPYPLFACHIPGCERAFDTVIQYEAHYNSCHSFTCKECNKNLPNYHLLDLHISETHDSFFNEQAKRKPMFKCFVEECKECFSNPPERRDHCIEIHKFPSDFRFDSSRKPKGQKKKKMKERKEKSLGEKMEIGVVSNEESEQQGSCEMDVTETKTTKKNSDFKGFSFGRSRGKRKPVFHNFSKDLMKSLPGS